MGCDSCGKQVLPTLVWGNVGRRSTLSCVLLPMSGVANGFLIKTSPGLDQGHMHLFQGNGDMRLSLWTGEVKFAFRNCFSTAESGEE